MKIILFKSGDTDEAGWVSHSKALYMGKAGPRDKVTAFSKARKAQADSSPTLPLGLFHLGHTLGPALPPSSPFSAASWRGQGSPDPRPLPKAPTSPLPVSFPARSQQQHLYLQVRLLYHLHVTWAKNSEALFSSENSPTGAVAALWLLLPKQ